MNDAYQMPCVVSELRTAVAVTHCSAAKIQNSRSISSPTQHVFDGAAVQPRQTDL